MDTVKQYMINNNVDVRDIELKSNDESIYNRFRVCFKVSDLEQVLQPDFWPTGVNVSRYYLPRNQHVQSWN